jgi:glucosamine 6-phosphate synthetase-like amidotransferase/phosphosugar isomerase protein
MLLPVFDKKNPNEIIAARLGSPLAGTWGGRIFYRF